MDNKAAIRFTWVLLILLIILAGVRIYLDIRNEGVIDRATQSYIEAKVSEEIEKIEKPRDGVDGTDGYTPQKYVDYFDGKDGVDGQDGTDGINGTNGVDGSNGADGADGEDGATPSIRCNATKDRWEVRYSIDESWQLLNGEVVKCLGSGDE